jgi:GxxExxY protein
VHQLLSPLPPLLKWGERVEWCGGDRRAGFVVEGKVLVELKALTHIEEVHWAQVLNYLKAYRLVETIFT